MTYLDTLFTWGTPTQVHNAYTFRNFLNHGRDEMLHVYIEPVPKGQWGPIDGYRIETEDGTKLSGELLRSEKLAVSEARLHGYVPLLATVRIPDKAVAEHWKPADKALMAV